MKISTYDWMGKCLSADVLPSVDEGIAFHNGVLRGLELAGWKVDGVYDYGVRLVSPQGKTTLLSDGEGMTTLSE